MTEPAKLDRSPGARIPVALNVFGMIMIAFAFLVILMTGVAQQEAVERMNREDLTIGYSSAFALVRDLEERRRELPALRAKERNLSGQHSKNESDVRQASEQFSLAWQSFRSVAQRLVRAGCEVALEESDLIGPRRTAWSDAQACVLSQPIAPALVRSFRDLEQGDRNVATTARAFVAAVGKRDRGKDELEAARAQIKNATELTDVEQKADRSFSEMAVLRSTGILGGRFLVAFPPPILQIILAFISGLFGALLVTLVLIVYPKANLGMASTQETWARIVLGGLIAVCVYVVLLGGSAVLGSTPGMTAAGTNYMAFCAIGILAGMFSDRVAFWLSEKADAFFRESQK